jgi:hypothetical protein
LFVVIVAELIAADSSSPGHRRVIAGAFSSAAGSFICSRDRRQADRAGRRTFRAFGKQLTALLAKILAFQAVILAF